jgi:hypothetical protein
MKTALSTLSLALTLALFSACAEPSTGSARFTVTVPQGLGGTVTRVTVVASASDFSPISLDLSSTGGTWSGTLGDIPAGSLRSFRAQAFDDASTLLFEGSVSGITITADETTLVAILLQEVNPPPPFQNEAPIIGSLVASSTTVLVGDSLSLVVSAHDPNTGDSLTYAWTSTAGAFSSSSGASTAWTAPTTPGIQTLTVTVTDSGGLATSASVAIHVTPPEMRGDALLTITFNRFPSITALSAAPTLLAVGQATSVSATASDAEGDTLSYAWTASCAGTWSNASSRAAQFTPSALPMGACNNCRLTVSVSDGRGGSTTGSVVLCVSNAPRINHFNPIISNVYQSSETATAGQVLTFEVAASDPEGSALTFAWSANTGLLGTPTTSATTSRILWTAPACAVAGTPTSVTSTVTNAFKLTATRGFTVTGLPACASGWASTSNLVSVRTNHVAALLPNGKVLITGGINGSTYPTTAQVYDPVAGTWSNAASMSTGRTNHTATLLPNGKVLVTGGSSLASAELYDPAPGTWSTASPMAQIRSGHTATLLSNGKVLVAGGETSGSIHVTTAEVYDPATGTWSTTGAMASPRSGHTATLLPNGKVLVMGGRSASSTYLATAEVYDPAAGTWSTTGAMASSRGDHTVTSLPSGKVLVTGGRSASSTYLATAEVYDPAVGTWSTTSPMAQTRGFHTATLLSGGKVLVTGGTSTIVAAEVYDPATGSWSAAGFPNTARLSYTATRLNNGRVLIAGGSVGSSQFISAELYTP